MLTDALASEVLRVDLGVFLPLFREVVEGEDCRNRAHWDAGAAIDALNGVDIKHLFRLVFVGVLLGMNAIHRAGVNTSAIFGSNAGLGNYVGHKINVSYGSWRLNRIGNSSRNGACEYTVSSGPRRCILKSAMNDFSQAVEASGFAIVPNVLAEIEIAGLVTAVSNPALSRSRAGIRHALGVPAIASVAQIGNMIGLARAIVGPEATPFRATLFDKSPVSNWLVVWHQDTALPFLERVDKIGWGPWSIKDGVNYAHAPATALEQVVALRVHLDESGLENGPLRVLPATHKRGVLTDNEIERVAEKTQAVDCLVGKGGVLAMRPLIVHASSKSSSERPRKVLHIEYASSRFLDDGLELARV
jgi:Phytanoyl-CoA dioxygenase (PhyH)